MIEPHNMFYADNSITSKTILLDAAIFEYDKLDAIFFVKPNFVYILIATIFVLIDYILVCLY